MTKLLEQATVRVRIHMQDLTLTVVTTTEKNVFSGV